MVVEFNLLRKYVDITGLGSELIGLVVRMSVSGYRG